MSKVKDREEFVSILTRENPDDAPYCVIRIARDLMRLTATHDRLCVQDCNVGLTKPETAKRERVESKIRELAHDLNAGVLFQYDPRGATVKLTVPSGKTNDWGQTAICVPVGN